MEMRKIVSAVLVAAAMTTGALASEAPAPGPAASASLDVTPLSGAALGAAIFSFLAYYMQKIVCAVLVAAAMTTGALASEAPASEAPAPGPAASASLDVTPVSGAALGAAVFSFLAYYLQ
ncbi:hypothetical protein ZIOFF_023100 [Zingiber officinale]|uniref:Arabinogalactan peptide 23-like n=1 Tax=Zingiber officinale TaxID=94328 RepID=A0A8J5LN77_ZINOF|nr:hypothetical protein ZIOFF_023100 [Zingiber officinale]